MKILLSIKPEYAEKILSGEKKFEFRKALPKDKGIQVVIIYATMPLGKVIGEFYIEDILSHMPTDLWNLTKEYAGITHEFFESYFEGRDIAHALKIKEAKRYDEYMSISEVLPSGVAPQSFCYIH